MAKNIYLKIIENDLSFKSRTRQERHVKSHPPDGVDLCQLNYRSIFDALFCIFWNSSSMHSVNK